MKVAENINSDSSDLQLDAKVTQPFFGREGQGDFFAETAAEATPFFQTKLTIGQPNDPYEKEADVIADAVVNQTNQRLIIQENKITPVSATDFTQRKCAACEEEEEPIQRNANGGEPTASPSLQSRLNETKGGGSSLPKETRTSMESSIGADFSGVRIHTDSAAVQMNKELGAQAFTNGGDVYFNKGKYNTKTSDGQHLLAHELTHVVQQGASPKIQRQVEDEVKVCGPDITSWLITQMITNGNSIQVGLMKGWNNPFTPWKWPTATALWYLLVRTGGLWDFKTVLDDDLTDSYPDCRQNCSGNLWSVTLDGMCMTYEVAANIHYGYVGRKAGFPEWFLLLGGDVAQTGEGTSDDPRDVQAIKVGFKLYDEENPSGFSASELIANHYNNLPEGSGDPEGCTPCSGIFSG